MRHRGPRRSTISQRPFCCHDGREKDGMKRLWSRITCWWNSHDGDDIFEAASPKWGTLVFTYRCSCGQEWVRTYFTDNDRIAQWIDRIRE